jgi:hypothetical protein
VRTPPAGYVTQSRDTSFEIEKRLIEHWRALPPAEKFRIVAELQRTADQLALGGLRLRHPGAREEELALRLVALKHGRRLCIEALGRDPDAHAG